MLEINLMETIMQDVLEEFKDSELFIESKGEYVTGYHYNDDNHYSVWIEYMDKDCVHDICARGIELRYNQLLTHNELMDKIIDNANMLKKAVVEGVYTLKGIKTLTDTNKLVIDENI